MPRTITDEQYAAYEKALRTEAFAESIFNSPQWGKDAKRLVKRVYPQLEIPGLDQDDKLEEYKREEKKRREDEANEKRTKEEDEQLAVSRKRVKEQYGFTDEAMKELEDFMWEKKVGDYEVAAAYRAAKAPKSIETTYSPHRWNHSQQKDFSDMAKDPDKWAENELLGAIRRDQERERGNAF